MSSKMYNLNINVATALQGNLLGIDGVSATPRTPEILNSLIAMTNPFDNFVKVHTSNSSIGSDESCSTNGSPLASPTNSPPSVQHTCSQLIKEGLKLTLQTKRKQSGSDSREEIEDFEIKKPKREELTQEDEERRKRRRERNKIAATKCRLKKREKTVNLVAESEILETQNVDLKTQIQDLEAQRRRLMDMLAMHAPNCVKVSQPGEASSTFDDDITYISDSLRELTEPFSEAEFRVDTVMNPYGKDPNFGKIADTSYTRLSPYTNYPPPTSTTTTNYYQSRNVLRANDCNRPATGGEFNRNQPTANFRPASTGNENSLKKRPTEMFRPNILKNMTNRSNEENDGDSYRPNGIMDANFYGNKPDTFYNEYGTSFANNLDSGCMA